MDFEVGIVGAGLAGLSCARELHARGVSFVLFEAADRVGGRVATDEEDGFLFDRGFQVLLDAYPEARRGLDFEALGTRPFAPGALVRKDGRFWRVVDPWRSPMGAIGSLRAPFVTLGDGLRMASLRRRALHGGHADERGTTADLLRSCGFSEDLLQSFFWPFFRGVTLDPKLEIPAGYFLDLFGWFASGSAVLPARGMRAIPEQLAAPLAEGSVRLGAAVRSVAEHGVTLASGEEVACGKVVVATDGSSAAELLGSDDVPAWHGTTTLHYAAQRSPVGEAILVLNGEGEADGPVNHLCVLSDAQPSYAPAGAALVSVSLLGVPPEDDAALDARARAQLEGWYGAQLEQWRLLRVERVPRALPRFGSRALAEGEAKGVLVCGDHVATPSIQGSMLSGRITAEFIAAG